MINLPLPNNKVMVLPTYSEWLADLKTIPREQQALWIKRTLRSKHMLHVFARFFFPNIIKGDKNPPQAHLELIQFLSSPRDGAAIFPRGFAKSTWEKIDTIHDIVYALEPVIVYISATLQDAQFHFESMKGEFEENDLLKKVYGNLVPDLRDKGVKWTNTHFETSNGVNLVARGANKGRGVNIRNQRPTKVIVDDAETDEQVRSTVRRAKYHRWIYEVIMPSLDKTRGRIKVIGTVIHPECEVLRFYKANGGIFRRAIENGESIWPDFWTLEDLKKKRDGYTDAEGQFHEGIGSRAFSQEYMNEPINDESAIFKQLWLDSFVYDSVPPREVLDQWFTIKMAVDPQSGESEQADFLGVCVMGLDRRTGKRWVLHSAKFKGSINKQLEFLYHIYRTWNPVTVGIEKVLNQTALYQLALAGYDVRDEDGRATGEKFYFRLMALSPKSKNKVDRSRYTEPLVEHGRVLFNPGHTDLYTELLQFPTEGVHDDVADAFIYVNAMFDQGSVKLGTERSSMITGGIRTKKF